MDGIGGRAKSIVRSSVMSKSNSAPIVQNARDFYELVSKLMPSTKVLLIKNEDIPRPANDWDNAEAILGIKKYHVIVAHSDETMKFYFNALDLATTVNNKPEVRQSNNYHVSKYKIGDWVLVRYDSQKYPGEVTKVIGSELEVSTMEKSHTGTSWKWPSNEDKIFYSLHDVIRNIKPPVCTGLRGQFKFIDEEL